MYRATTPKHSFIFDVDPEEQFKEILITYAQGNKIVLEKRKEDLSFEQATTCCGEKGYSAYFKLTQKEANMFSAKNGTVYVQVRVLTYADEAVAFEKKVVSLQDVLNDEVLT